jgi:DNA-binding SARP family transcriptional activator
VSTAPLRAVALVPSATGLRVHGPAPHAPRPLARGHTARLSVSVLGPVVVAVDGAPVDGLRPFGRALVARLALAGGQVVAVGQLIDALWAERLPVHPSAALRVGVSRVRKALGPLDVVRHDHHGYRLVGVVEVDVARFAARAALGRRLFEEGRAEPAARALRDALGLWRGEALADVRGAAFAAAEAARLELERRAVVAQRVAADLACGRHHELLGELAALVVEHPYDEQLWAHRIVALYRAGRQADALRAYAEVRQRLSVELGLAPSPPLQALESSVLRHAPELARPGEGSPMGIAGF